GQFHAGPGRAGNDLDPAADFSSGAHARDWAASAGLLSRSPQGANAAGRTDHPLRCPEGPGPRIAGWGYHFYHAHSLNLLSRFPQLTHAYEESHRRRTDPAHGKLLGVLETTAQLHDHGSPEKVRPGR